MRIIIRKTHTHRKVSNDRDRGEKPSFSYHTECGWALLHGERKTNQKKVFSLFSLNHDDHKNNIPFHDIWEEGYKELLDQPVDISHLFPAIPNTRRSKEA